MAYDYNSEQFLMCKLIEQEALSELQEIQSNTLSEQQRFRTLAENCLDLKERESYLKIAEIMQKDINELNNTINRILN
jgi:hypothetical protein